MGRNSFKKKNDRVIVNPTDLNKIHFSENQLYKSPTEFSWKDATQSEVKEEAIKHYGLKFVL